MNGNGGGTTRRHEGIKTALWRPLGRSAGAGRFWHLFFLEPDAEPGHDIANGEGDMMLGVPCVGSALVGGFWITGGPCDGIQIDGTFGGIVFDSVVGGEFGRGHALSAAPGRQG